MNRVDIAIQWFALVALFCAPLSKPGTNIALGLLALLLPFASNIRERIATQFRSPLVQTAAFLFVVYALSALKSPNEDAASQLWAYRTLFAVGFVAIALPTDAMRIRAWVAFIVGVAILFFLSLLSGFGAIPKVSNTAIGQFSFAKHYGQQGLVYTVAAAACASFGLMKVLPRYRKLFAALGVAFVLATPLMLEGRTTWIVLAIVLFLLSIQFFGASRGAMIAAVATMIVSVIAWVSPLKNSRWLATKTDVAAAIAGDVSNSWGVRAELLRIAPKVIAEAPYFGHGIGTWNAQMNASAPERMNPLIEKLTNPHQELLFVAAEQGLLGVLVYLGIALLLIRCVCQMQGLARPLYVTLLATYLGYGLFNTVLADFTHRHVFLLLLAVMPLNLRSYESDKGIHS